jgi:hypothetical protein
MFEKTGSLITTFTVLRMRGGDDDHVLRYLCFNIHIDVSDACWHHVGHQPSDFTQQVANVVLVGLCESTHFVLESVKHATDLQTTLCRNTKQPLTV